MRSLMADNHKSLLLAAMPADGTLIEWGSGGTTRWLLENMQPTQRLVSVEHHPDWAEEVYRACSQWPNWTLHRMPSVLPVGENATHWEECPAGLSHYICGDAVREADVILIDGVARGACLAWACAVAKPGATVFFHDVAGTAVDRVPWYAWAMWLPRVQNGRRFIHPSDGSYPPSLLEVRLA